MSNEISICFNITVRKSNLTTLKCFILNITQKVSSTNVMSLQYIKYIELEHVHVGNLSIIAHSYHIRTEKAHLFVIPNIEESDLVHPITVPAIPLWSNVFTFSITCRSAKYVILNLTFFTTNQFMFYENHHMNTSVFPSKYKKSFINVCVIQQWS